MERVRRSVTNDLIRLDPDLDVSVLFRAKEL
jgi:hypothetical protein